MSHNHDHDDDSDEDMQESTPGKFSQVPNETLPPVEEYIPEYNPRSECQKCGETSAGTDLCEGKPRGWFRRTCAHGHKIQHHVRTCKRCSFVWIEACLDGKPRGGMKLEMINDLWVVVRLTYPDKGASNEDLKKRLEDVRVIAQNLNGYINIL